MSILMPVLIVVHVLVCLLMALVVLMQRPRSEGLGSAFGGGITDNVFGSQTTNVLAKFTTWMAIAFFAVTLLLSIITAKSTGGKTAVQKELLSAPVPVATPTPAPEATPAEPSGTPEPTPVPQASPEPSHAEIAPALGEAQPATEQASSAGLETATETAQPVSNEATPVLDSAQPVESSATGTTAPN